MTAPMQVRSRPGMPESFAVALAEAAVAVTVAEAVLGNVVELVGPVVVEASSEMALDMPVACYQTHPALADKWTTRSGHPSSRSCGCAGSISDGAETGSRGTSAALAEDDVGARLPGRSC